MTELDSRDKSVLSVLAKGRVNPMMIREETDLDKGDVNTVLNRLARAGYVRQVTHALYELTDYGEERLSEHGITSPGLDIPNEYRIDCSGCGFDGGTYDYFADPDAPQYCPKCGRHVNDEDGPRVIPAAEEPTALSWEPDE
ncbi:MarR family winged helix-turn-helix transcriptional regulator [Halorubrum sp. SD683]|uniref:MarR family winged helix-turn-helix transcriptional regulator n=1 Tax=Halorubrum sp. SD683 TaxID=1855873 RepID=UPI0018E95898|nr:MarR family winged helix-turn-helix transcriptional regulator [Halorubrum sp. SD683]